MRPNPSWLTLSLPLLLHGNLRIQRYSMRASRANCAEGQTRSPVQRGTFAPRLAQLHDRPGAGSGAPARRATQPGPFEWLRTAKIRLPSRPSPIGQKRSFVSVCFRPQAVKSAQATRAGSVAVFPQEGFLRSRRVRRHASCRMKLAGYNSALASAIHGGKEGIRRLMPMPIAACGANSFTDMCADVQMRGGTSLHNCSRFNSLDSSWPFPMQ